MHDPTEGGLATGLWELAHASGKGIVVEADRIPVFPEALAFCEALDLDPLGLIASGALLVAAAPEESARMIEALVGAGIGAAVIGEAVEGPAAVRMQMSGELVPMPVFDQDELARVLA
jgi:hydrogenase maturation factor